MTPEEIRAFQIKLGLDPDEELKNRERLGLEASIILAQDKEAAKEAKQKLRAFNRKEYDVERQRRRREEKALKRKMGLDEEYNEKIRKAQEVVDKYVEELESNKAEEDGWTTDEEE
jgi:hypothetical protein